MAYDFPDDINFLDSTDILMIETLSNILNNVTKSNRRTKPKQTMSEKIYKKYGVRRDDPDYDGYREAETSINAFFD